VTLIATNACGSDTTTQVVNAIVGIEDALLGQISIFPNPNKGQFTVDLLGNSATEVEITVFDQLGRSIHHQVGGLRQTVSLTASSGMYMVQLTTAEGKAWSRMILE
jgi:hypothetical protein